VDINHNGFKEITKEFKRLGETKVANEVWEEVKRYWRKIPASQSDQGLELRRILRDYKSQESGEKEREAILETTKVNSKENKKI